MSKKEPAAKKTCGECVNWRNQSCHADVPQFLETYRVAQALGKDALVAEKCSLFMRKGENEYHPSEVSHPRTTFFDKLLEDERARTIVALLSEDERSILLGMLTDAGGPAERFTTWGTTLLWVITGISKEFWVARDKNYREWVEKMQGKDGEG